MLYTRIVKRLCLVLALIGACVGLAACEVVPGAGMGMGTSSSGGQSLTEMVNSGLSIQAEKGSGDLEIKRMKPGGREPAGIEKDTWTVFVYLCGSNLESQGGAATKDLTEMINASGSEKVRFVVETGGAKSWRNNTVDARKLGRYVIQGGSIMDAGAVSAAAMGDAGTLSSFLTWGVKNFPADHMALIMWDHGGGSITGVCFDERNNNDSLALRELDEALAATYATMWEKFEFVGFDACLMSTLETANVLASYAKYMIASQESEPANGWEYSSLVDYLATHPYSTGNEFGKALCNSYLASLDNSTKGFATLAVVDLAQIDALLQSFYHFSQEMYASGNDQKTLAAMSRGIQQADNYGCNNRREGFTNMVDLGGLVDACADVTPSAAEVKEALHKAVTYQIRGNYHADATGLSTYYPLKINTSKELAIFQQVATNPSYLSYVDRLAHGATYNGGTQYQQYTGDSFFDDNIWNWLLGNTTQELQQQTEYHWNYVDDHSDASTQVSFASQPQVDEEGTYWFQLDENGINNASVVSGIVYEVSVDGEDLIALGETYDIYGDWETGEFSDGFDGKWLSLPDGQSLNLSVESATEDYIVYTSPIMLNGSECYLRMTQQVEDGSVVVDGVWSGITSQGAVDRGVTKVKRGDVIIPLYRAFSADENVTESTYEGEPFTVSAKSLVVGYDYLPDGTYVYGFSIQDAFGDSFFTDTVQFEIDEEGKIYF